MEATIVVRFVGLENMRPHQIPPMLDKSLRMPCKTAKFSGKSISLKVIDELLNEIRFTHHTRTPSKEPPPEVHLNLRKHDL